MCRLHQSHTPTAREELLQEQVSERARPAAHDGQAGPVQPSGYKWKVLATVVFGIFMVILDTTVVNIAFQTLREEFGSNLNDAQWIISVYVLALGISTPLAGFLADRFGIKRVYLGGLGIFVLGSLACGLAPSLGLMVAARGLQGFGGGIALPLGTALLFSAFPVAEQGMALGIFGIAAIVAPAIGPILGGWLVDNNLWRMIFFINPPIGAVGIVLGTRFLREHRSNRRPALDGLGLVTEIIGFGAILYAASNAATLGWGSPSVWGAFLVGIIGLVLFGIVELFFAREPLLDLRLFKKRIFLNASVLGWVSVIALFGAEFLMPLYLQSLRGLSALETGLVLLPLAITGGISVTLAGRLYDRLGPRPLVAVGFGILMLNTWQLSQIRADTPISWILVLLALRGIALGLTVQTTLVTALSVVPLRELARGSSLTNASRNLVQAIGVAVLATILASTISPEIQQLQQAFMSAPLAGSAPTHMAGICETVQVGRVAVSLPAIQASTGAAALVAADRGVRPVIALAAVGNAPAPVATLVASARPAGAQPPAGDPPPAAGALLQRACQENVAGFERAYTITFIAAGLALILGLMLPGWPSTWGGRRAADAPQAIAH
jgi:EmrB/QacA subfamily drug resistance transporter